MSEKDYNRCDRECEQIFENRQREAEIAAEAEAEAAQELEQIQREQAKLLLQAKQKQAYRDGCWLASFASGAFLVLCVMFACSENIWMAVASGLFSVIFGITCAYVEPMAYGYCGKRVKK